MSLFFGDIVEVLVLEAMVVLTLGAFAEVQIRVELFCASYKLT